MGDRLPPFHTFLSPDETEGGPACIRCEREEPALGFDGYCKACFFDVEAEHAAAVREQRALYARLDKAIAEGGAA